MAKNVLERIKQQVLERSYDISNHVVPEADSPWRTLNEAADEGVDIFDIDTALLTGRIVKKYTKDPRGTRYKIVGTATDNRRYVAVVGRFRGDKVFRIITVYETEA